MKRHFYLWHRWLGIGLCSAIALWLVSGVVMLYVGYPKLTHAESLARLPPLDCRSGCVNLERALLASGNPAPPREARLVAIAGKPHYLFGYSGQPEVAVDARSGRRVDGVDHGGALASARTFSKSGELQYVGIVVTDAWSDARSLDAERPFHVLQETAGERRRLYVSTHSGRVLLDATEQERTWGWLGAWLHWFYPLHDFPWWAEVIIYLSLVSLVTILFGLYVGVDRWRFGTPYRSGARTPYVSRIARWHHVAGLLFGFVLAASAFSGMMSMRPWQLLDSRSTLLREDYAGGKLGETRDQRPMDEILQMFRETGLEACELVWHVVGGTGYLTAYDRTGKSKVLAMGSNGTVMDMIPEETLRRAAQAMMPDRPIRAQQLDTYDFYYYPRAEQSMYGGFPRRLPVLRVMFDDPARTWLHLDPYSGAVIDQPDGRRRIARRLFNLLHSWDAPWFLEHPRTREMLLAAFSIGGLIVCCTGPVRWLQKRRARAKQAARLATRTP